MSELLFEAFGVQSVAYGIDSAFSHYYNNPKSEYGLILSLGNASVTVLPMCRGKVVTEHGKRTSFGAVQAYDHMLKFLKHKYPNFPLKIDVSCAQQFVKNYCYTSLDYSEDVRELENSSKIREQEIVIQFPYTQTAAAPPKSMAVIAEQRREQAARMREERSKSKKRMLEGFKYLKKKKSMTPSEYAAYLRDHDFENEEDLDKEIKTLETAIYRSDNKTSINEDEQESKKKPVADLVNVPDDELSEDKRKEKRKQKLLLAGYEARERARREKQAEKEHQLEIARLDEERRLKDPGAWLQNLRDRRQKIIDKIQSRQKKKILLSDRRSRESQLRMKSIANLVGEDITTKRRSGNNEKDSEDTFGADDDDWFVYRQINKDYDSSGEDDLVNLNKTEELLMTHDPAFVPEDVFEEKHTFKNTIIYRLAYGPNSDHSDAAILSQIRLNIERIRIPEIFFNPTIAGLPQAGISEVLSNILNIFDPKEQQLMAENIFLTGGFSKLPNLSQRIEADLSKERPYPTSLKISLANDPILDAWRGASSWAHSDTERFLNSSVTRKVYDECGHDYIVEHNLGNRWWTIETSDPK